MNLPNEKEEILQKWAGHSGRRTPDTPVGPDTPVCVRRTLRCRGRCSSIWRKFQPKFLRSVGKLARLAARNAKGLGAITQITKSLDQNHKKRTQTRDRSETKFGAFYEIFRFLGEKRFRGEILGNQKLLIPICCGLPARVARCSRIPKGMRGIRGEGRRKADAEATNTKNTAKTQLTQRKIKDALLTPVIKPVQLNLTESLG